MNIDFKTLGAKIHLSYKEINAQNSLSKLLEDSHKLTFKHTQKAQYIDETPLDNRHGATGILYEIGGNAASNAQFFLTDSVRHYIRGSLYFSNAPNEDSLAPVIRFVKADMMRLADSFRWQ
jgi:gliding motility-associated lipoprotein GldD